MVSEQKPTLETQLVSPPLAPPHPNQLLPHLKLPQALKPLFSFLRKRGLIPYYDSRIHGGFSTYYYPPEVLHFFPQETRDSLIKTMAPATALNTTTYHAPQQQLPPQPPEEIYIKSSQLRPSQYQHTRFFAYAGVVRRIYQARTTYYHLGDLQRFGIIDADAHLATFTQKEISALPLPQAQPRKHHGATSAKETSMPRSYLTLYEAMAYTQQALTNALHIKTIGLHYVRDVVLATTPRYDHSSLANTPMRAMTEGCYHRTEDVNDAIAYFLQTTYPERFPPQPSLERKIEQMRERKRKALKGP